MPYSEITYIKLRSWADQALLLLREVLPLMSPVGKFAGWTHEERQTLGYLLSACARSTESAVLLVAYAQLWDAELLVRSIAEGTLKYCYLMQSQENFSQRHREYSHDLWRIALSKDHRKAAAFLASVPDPSAPEWQPIRDRLLRSEDLAQINRDYNQKQKRSLEAKWGYTGLVGELAKSGDQMFAHFEGFAHSYSLASHILHADQIGVSIPIERDQRSDVRRDALHIAHSTRLLGDCFTYLHLRLLVSYRFLASDPKPIVNAWYKVEEFKKTLDEAYQEWFATEYPRTADDR